MSAVIRIAPFEFVHVVDSHTNITRLVNGPRSLVQQNHERLVAGPLPMIIVPPACYCVVQDPMSKYEEGKACELQMGQTDVRFHQVPFPLYPGESLAGVPQFGKGSLEYKAAIRQLPVIKANHAIRLRSLIDHEDGSVLHREEDMWQIEGPLLYHPTPYAAVVNIVKPVIIRTGQILKLRATQDTVDRDGRERVTGEEWMVCQPGAYLPNVYETVVVVVKKITLTPDTGLRLRAKHTVVDYLKKKRLAGEEWLLTGEETVEYFPEIGVEVVSHEKKVVLSKGQFCVILDPVLKSTGKPQLGKRKLKTGPSTFFLYPGEKLEKGVEDAYLLAESESLVLQAIEKFTDVTLKAFCHEPGDRWLIKGPLEYIPPISVMVIKKRERIPLSKNEGIYVQNMQTGDVRDVMGPQSYMLMAEEELWEKKLPDIVETLLKQGGGAGSGEIRKMAYFEQSIDPQILKGRIKTRVVTYRCPSNTAVQVNNYLSKTARVIFGPDLVVLGPHEDFNVLSLSAGKPKVQNALKSLCLMLGPDFITDILEVETSDHARLRVKFAFNNHFEYKRGDLQNAARLFSIPDFIGFACRQIGARIRGAVAFVAFDEFHRHSVRVIQSAVFGQQENGNLTKKLMFPANNLVISSIDIQSIEPVDVKMRDSLSKSVQLAIEISTKSTEAAATHEAMRNEQVAKGELERQKLLNEKESEKERTKLLELQAITAAVESTGSATAEAQAQAEKTIIECESEIEVTKLRMEAAEIDHYCRLKTQEQVREQELYFQATQNEIELEKERQMTNIEVKKMKELMEVLGTDTLAAIYRAGPEIQCNLLKGLGLESVLITDGNSPLNLFGVASGLLGGK